MDPRDRRENAQVAPERLAHFIHTRNLRSLKGQQRLEDLADQRDKAGSHARCSIRNFLVTSDKGIAENTFHPKALALQCSLARVVTAKQAQATKDRFENVEWLRVLLRENRDPLVDVACILFQCMIASASLPKLLLQRQQQLIPGPLSYQFNHWVPSVLSPGLPAQKCVFPL